MNIRRRPSWLRVTVVSLAIFLSVLALLAFRVTAGEDPVLGAQASNAQVTNTLTADDSGSSATSDDETSSDDGTASSSSSGVPSISSSSSSSSIPTTSAS